MDAAAARASVPAGVVFRDGLGERRRIADPTGHDTIEVLCLRGELTAVPAFEFALRERVSRLGGFRHPSFGRVRSVERLNDANATLAVVSDGTPGARLSDVLTVAEQHRLTLDINAALFLVRQLVPAVAALHDTAQDVSHGAIAPERIIISANGGLMLVEHVLGAALEQLRYSHERYWKELRIASPRSAGLPRFDHRADVTEIGVVALALILGRPLRDDEYPARVGDVLAGAWAMSARGGYEPLPVGLRSWLARALQVDVRNAFTTVAEALEELERVIAEGSVSPSGATLDAYLRQYSAAAQQAPRPAAPAPAPPRPPVPQPQSAPAPRPVVPAAASAPVVPAPQASAPAPRVIAPPPTVAVASQPRVAIDPPPPPPRPAPTAPVYIDPPSTAVELSPLAVTPKQTPPVRAAAIEHEPIVVLPNHDGPDDVDTIDADDDEAEADEMTHSRRSRPLGRMLLAAGLLIGVAGGGVFVARNYAAAPAPHATTGTLAVTTEPAGANLIVDGTPRGVTPITLTLNPGPHSVEVRAGSGAPRMFPVTIVAGSQTAQYLDLPKTAAAGQLEVRTEPAGAQVTVDGVAHGPSPVTVSDLSIGEHIVTVQSDLGVMKQTVKVEAGVLASLVVPLTAPQGAPVSGWISVTAPADVELYENGRLLGTSRLDRLMLAAGAHQIEMVNNTLGYRATRSVQVSPGKTTAIKVEFPKGTIALNAIPWADVWIDGEKVGETPIGNLELAIGSHEIVFRNPDLGEKRQVATITLDKPARLSVDMRQR